MTFIIETKKREPGHPETDRAQGFIPGVVYGPDMSPISIAAPYQAFQKMYALAGQSSLIDVSVDGGAPIKALVQEVAYDPVSERMTHVDFRQINMKKPMTASVTIVFLGEAPAVKGLGGTLVKALSALRVSCLPENLVGRIEVDISPLKNFSDILRVSDIPLPSGITVLDDPQTTVVKALAPFTEEQLKAMEEAGPKSVEEIEVAEKKKKEAEEGEETAGSEEKPSGKEQKQADKK